MARIAASNSARTASLAGAPKVVGHHHSKKVSPAIRVMVGAS
jgi:hypothetical protein